MELKEQLQEKIDNLNKPKGSLGTLESLALQIGLIQETLTPQLKRPCHVLFGADHGIEREGVSVSPREITWQQMINFTKGGGGVNMFCRQHRVNLTLVDVGVDYDLSAYPTILNRKVSNNGTGNFLHEPAMDNGELLQAMMTGSEIVQKCASKGCNVISFGEMGIGNTSPSSIWMHLFLDIPLEKCVGAGAGLNNDGIRHKLDVLQRSVDRFKKEYEAKKDEMMQGSDVSEDTLYNMEIIRQFGGFEMVAATGAMLEAARRKMVILVDGFIMSACMLAASRLNPEVMKNAIFCHQGDESGHKMMLDGMGVKGLLNLGLRLGEGTGALCAYPIIKSAVRMINEMNNFENASITKYF